MKKRFSVGKAWFIALAMTFSICGSVSAQNAKAQVKLDAKLQEQLEFVYYQWRAAMMTKNYRVWALRTAKHKQVAIHNRIVSEKRAFPASLFAVPVKPPTLKGLTPLRVERKGNTANAVYFGKIDFGVGGKPTENLYLLSFIVEDKQWKYSDSDFISLVKLPKVRSQIKAGNYSYVSHKDFGPSGVAPFPQIQVSGAKYIAKVYVLSPGREVKVKVNRISDHRFQNDSVSEIIIGGAKDGINEISFSTKSLEGSTGKEPLVIRVYLMSTVKGVKPIKKYEYHVKPNGRVKNHGNATFFVEATDIKKLKGR